MGSFWPRSRAWLDWSFLGVGAESPDASLTFSFRMKQKRGELLLPTDTSLPHRRDEADCMRGTCRPDARQCTFSYLLRINEIPPTKLQYIRLFPLLPGDCLSLWFRFCISKKKLKTLVAMVWSNTRRGSIRLFLFFCFSRKPTMRIETIFPPKWAAEEAGSHRK